LVDLAIVPPLTFDFVVNLKTAQALGLTFPNEIMLQVTEANSVGRLRRTPRSARPGADQGLLARPP
jgi:hypothetical protein